jgi:hypothetical protein
MPWVKLDDGFMEHPKVVAAGGHATLLFVAGLCYCARNLTDGKIPAAMVPRLTDLTAPMKLARKLVVVGLWEEIEGGYLVHDWLDWNPSAAETLAKRAAASETKRKAGLIGAMKRWGKKPGDTGRSGSTNGSGEATCHPAAKGSVIRFANGTATEAASQTHGPDPDPDPERAAAASTAAQQKLHVQTLAAEIGRYAAFTHLDASALAEQHGRGLRDETDLQRALEAIRECVAKTGHGGLSKPQLEREIGTFILRATGPKATRSDATRNGAADRQVVSGPVADRKQVTS